MQASAQARLKADLKMGTPEARAIVMKAIQDCGAVVDDTKQGTGLEWDEVEPSEVAVPLDRILDQLVAQLGRFLCLPAGAADVIATWIAWTYVEPLSSILPTLAISSPTKGCGKTLLLDVISVFVEKPFDSATVTPAAIFRTIEAAHPTMLLDEADRWMKQDATGEKVAIVVGGIVLAAQKSHTEISLQWLEMQIQALERPHDRRLFGPDDARENNGDDAAKKTKPATATAPPITDKQKGLLARLVEQQPEIAREIGIDPEEPGLEKLTKNEANPLIGKALERLKTEDIRLMNS